MVFSLLHPLQVGPVWISVEVWKMGKNHGLIMGGYGRKNLQETAKTITKPPIQLIEKEPEQQSNAVNASFTGRYYIYMMRYGICLGWRLQPTGGWTIFSCYIFQDTFHVIHPLYSVVQLYISQLLFLRFFSVCSMWIIIVIVLLFGHDVVMLHYYGSDVMVMNQHSNGNRTSYCNKWDYYYMDEPT